ncbi:MAG TPA: protease pro-enzyme activation domain-containing protein, partial [Bryobacteraceae bacterium]|nr:protease pro-enzyme activation domain-containing protein [Bryobacteraceae bacterium]
MHSLQRAALGGLLVAASALAAGPPSRLQAEIQNRETFRLTGNVHKQIASAEDQGEVAESLALPRITMHFKMTAAQQADLDRLLESQQDPSSPQFHQWLTPEEYADRFGLSAADLSRITGWLERMGFSNVQGARSRTFVTMSGVAAVVRYAFQTPIHHYVVNGIKHYANATDPALPVELEGMVAGIRGLSDFRPRPHARPKPRYTSPGGNQFIAPGDFATIYNVQALYNGGTNGAGESIVVVGQTGQTGQLDFSTTPPSPAWVQVSDMEAFETASGLPIKDPTIISNGFNPQASSGDEQESALDLEWAGAVARGATIIYVNSSDAFSSVQYAIDNNVGPILSVTYGLCEDASKGGLPLSQVNSMNALFQQANAQGITVVAAAGDLGAAD